MPNPDSERLTLAEAAEMLGMSPATLGRWARQGRIPSEATPDGVRIFRRSDLLNSSLRQGETGEGERQ